MVNLFDKQINLLYKISNAMKRTRSIGKIMQRADWLVQNQKIAY